METIRWMSLIIILGLFGITFLGLAIKIVRQYERGVVLRFGRLIRTREPGFNMIIPIVDRMIKVDLRVVTMVVEPQVVITKDNVTIKVDAVVYFMVVDPVKAVIQVADYIKATSQIALTTLRSVLGQSDLDELLFERDKINKRLREIIDQHTEPWGGDGKRGGGEGCPIARSDAAGNGKASRGGKRETGKSHPCPR